MSSKLTPQKMQVVVVGLGRIGFGFHCPAVAKHPGYTLVGVVDPLEARRREAEASWAVAGFEDLESALVALRPQLVVIASPTNLHAAQAQLAFAHGAHVLCDKPVANSLEEFDQMVCLANKADRRIVAYQPSRYRPEVRMLKGLLEENLIGTVFLIRRSRCNFERRNDWQAFRKNGGGLLKNYGSHCIDELQWLLSGREIKTIYCQTRRVVSAGDAEDFVKATFTCGDDLMIDLEISQASSMTALEWEIFGTHGAARYHAESMAWHIKYFDPKEAPAPQVQTSLAAAGRLYHTEDLPWREVQRSVSSLAAYDYYDALLKHLIDDAAAPVAVDETRLLLALIGRCQASAETNTIT